MSQTKEQKATQIIGALALPEGHYAVQQGANQELVGDVTLNLAKLNGEPDIHHDQWMMVYVTTAVWFQLYESTESGIVWTLCLPDPNNPRTRCEPPHLEYELLDITVMVHFTHACMDHRTLSNAIANAKKVDGIPVLRTFGE